MADTCENFHMTRIPQTCMTYASAAISSSSHRFAWSTLALFIVGSLAQADDLAPPWDVAPPWESLLQRETAAIRDMRGWASNIQFHRDSGRVRFIRFSRPHVVDEHLRLLGVFDQLRYLAVVTPNVTDSGVAHAARLRQLEVLMLSDSGISDVTMPWIGAQRNLQKLYLDRTGITDAGIGSLKDLPHLEELTLAGVKVSRSGLAELADLPKLRLLSLAQTSCGDEELQVFAARDGQWAALESLSLDGAQLNGDGLAALAKLPKLRELSLVGAKLSSESLSHLAALPRLKQMILWQAEAPAEAVASLRKSLPNTQTHFQPPPSLWRRWRAERTVSQIAHGGVSPSSPAMPAHTESAEQSQRVAEVRWDADGPDFQRHVLPLLGRLGCNGRTCHGSFQGRGGFRLSMFGYDFAADLEAIAQGESPRVDLADPTESLLLYKPTHGDEHGGGQRLDEGSWQYRLLKEWIRHGAKGVENPSQPRQLLRLEVLPSERVFAAVGEQVQMRCFAVWADGRREDVTRLTRFQTNDAAVAKVTPEGQLTIVGAGETHIISMYDNGVFATQVLLPRSADEAIPQGTQNAEKQFRVSNPASLEADRLVESKLNKLGIVPSEPCDDATFLRRVSLDIAGTLPTPDEVRRFVADKSSDKRARVIDTLLESPAHATWLAMWLSDLTGSNAQYLGTTDMNQPAAQQWNAWLRRRVEENAGWDDIAAGILLATSREPGETYAQYAARQSTYLRRKDPEDFSASDQAMHYYWFRSNNQQPADRALAFGYIFLGIRLQCAQCHKHPFDRWSQEDFEQFSNFFRRIKTGAAPDAVESQRLLKSKLGVPERLNTAALRRQMYLRVSAEGLPIPWNEVWVEPPVGGKLPQEKRTQQTARVLGGRTVDLSEVADPREPLVAWLLSPENPYFAKAMVNRMWRRYLGVGIVEPADDLNRANPPSNAELIDWLAEQFVERGYDLRWLQRTICNTAAYQRHWQPTKTNREDERNFARATLRRLPAEVTIDAILQATANDVHNANWLRDLNARKIAQHPKSIQARGIDYSLLIFGKPLRTTNCDCQRQDQPTLLQSLYVRNDSELLGMLERSDGWLQQMSKDWGLPLSVEAGAGVAAPSTDVEVDEEALAAAVEQAYLRTLSRRPTAEERENGWKHLQSLDNPLEGLRDLLWALVNTQEFRMNH